MSFTPLNFDAIYANLMRDINNLADDARIAGDSDWAIRAASVASAVEGLYQHQVWIKKQIFPDDADKEYLEKHCALRKIFRKDAVPAGGNITVSGVANTPFNAGLTLVNRDGRVYVTTAAAVLDGNGSALVAVQALVAGEAGDLVAGEALTFQAPPNGITTAVSAGITGGLDQELDANLLGRLLDRIQHPPAGGNKYDFRRWALEVPGVTAAYVYPLRRGEGTVDVVITAGSQLPAPSVIAAAQAHVEDVRPVTAKGALVLAPTLRTVAITASVRAAAGYSLATLQTALQSVVDNYFLTLAPGDSVIANKLSGLLNAVPGVADCQLTAPSANVVPVIDANKVEWLRAGVVAFGAM